MALIGLFLLLVAAGCGGGTSHGSGGFYTAASIKKCLVESAGVKVWPNDAHYVDGDASGGTFQVVVERAWATVAFASSEVNAAKTEYRAQKMLGRIARVGDLAHHRGNVAYWQLNESDAPVRAVEHCLENTPTDQSLDSQL